jgi:YegS/Rv2252/BmrU family lipid kinase
MALEARTKIAGEARRIVGPVPEVNGAYALGHGRALSLIGEPFALPAQPPLTHHGPMVSSSAWFVIVNPASGGGRAGRRWPDLASALTDAGVAFEAATTAGPGHAVSVVRECLGRGYRRLLAVGGDGILHEVVNGAMGQDSVPPLALAIGAAPLGSGNDWARAHGIPSRPVDMARCVATGRTAAQDVGRLDFPDCAGPERSCFFINVAGAGLDAHVLERLPARIPRKLAYLVGVLRSLATYSPPAFRLQLDDAELRSRLLLTLLALGPFCGGGMRLAPAARTDDGLLDVVLVEPLRLPRELLRLGRLFDGRLPEERFVRQALARNVRIETSPPAAVQADGQLVGHTPVVATLLPRAIMMLRT